MINQTLHYLSQGTGVPFLFIHGLGSDHHQSREFLNPISGIRKIMVDCPAHGQSPLPVGDKLNFNYMTDEIIRLIDTMNIDHFLVGGISMGSGICMNMMVRYPGRIAGAVLVRPAWLDKAHPFNLSLMEMTKNLVNHPDPQQLFRSSPEFKKLEQKLPNAAKSLMGQFSRPQGFAATTRLLQSMINDAPVKNLSDLSTFSRPACIVTNQSDPMHPAIFGHNIHEILPQSELHDVFPKYLDADKHLREAQEIIQGFVNQFDK